MSGIGGLAARLLLALSVAIGGSVGLVSDNQDDSPWYGVDEDGDVEIHFYFAHSTTCPHCVAAQPWVEALESRYEWIVVHSLPLNTGSQPNIDLATALAADAGETLQSVPSFLYCEEMSVGFTSAETTGALIEEKLRSCHTTLAETVQPEEPEPADEEVVVPVIGEVDPDDMSLPLFTVVIAGLDAFNPCAFFVLLFLLSLLVHARSRRRMALIGGTFVLVSGLVYFAFMVAWLNVFLVFGALSVVTVLAGVMALVIAAINIKDYFWFSRGPSLSIPDSAKPGLFARMRRLTTSTSLPLMLAGTVTLALAANAYELLCTAGFPMVYTRVLTLSELSTPAYYGYLALYNVVYVIPLLGIVAVFVWTLGSRKLSEQGGRTLKLVSGLMMGGLGIVLLVNPGLLENLITAPAVLLGSLAVAGLIRIVDRARDRISSRSSEGPSSPGKPLSPRGSHR